MAKIGPAQGSANLQIEQSEEEDEEMGQQLVRSGKGSYITRPAMMGGDKKETDFELSTRRQKRCVCITSSAPLFQLCSRICVYISRVVACK